MHELGITRNIVAVVTEAARGRPVECVTLEIGKLSGVMSEAIVFCFEAVVQGTALEGARLVIREPEGRARCLDCGRELMTPSLATPCGCGSRRLQRLAGEELLVKTMQLAEEAA